MDARLFIVRPVKDDGTVIFMKPLYFCFAVLLWGLSLAVMPSFAGSAMAAGDGFFSVIEDLPLVPGTTEDEDAALVFETAEGRVVEVYASGTVTKKQVLRFFAETLPQLGWKKTAANRFRRGDEALVIDFSEEGEKAGETVYHLKLAPRSASAS